MNPIQNLYSSKDFCLEELKRIRDMWSNRNTFTDRNIQGAKTSLGFMALYCPNEIQSLVIATIEELNKREMYFLFYGGKLDE